ncbi:ataxin-2-like protein [Saccostrea cucullata]|uniref:ataxin-2-like protein n=1 Tax=Saccostrea cuccullata TaxID=36930 RepID=UPI002ED2DBF5
MMSMNANRRKSRQNSGPSVSRNNNRTRGYEKNVAFDGIYSNPRFSHLLASLVGCVVQLQVKNGGVYDGILKTNSPKMDVVLEMAHKHEESSNNNTNNTTPSKDRLIEKVIFNMSDILSITSVDVDLDYAVKDTFTDSAISKCNSNHSEADLKVLQPWEGGEGEELGGLEREPANGWDPNEMFRTNEEKFNVQSKYDDSLTQYTTPLEKRDTKEFRSREEEAERLANEIEKSEQYKQHISLENGDGDEEEKFSAVKRTNENNTNMLSSGNSGKYIPPNKRSGMQGNRGRGGYSSNQRPQNSIPPRLQHLHQNHPHNFHPNPNHASPPHHHHHPPHHQTSTEEPRLNGMADKDERDRRSEERKAEDRVERDKRQEERRPEEKRSDIDTNVKSSLKQEPVTPHVAPEKPDPVPHTSPVPLKPDRRSSAHKNRAEVLNDLKDFKKNFKVSFDGKKDDHKETVETKSEDSVVHEAPAAAAVSKIPLPQEALATENKSADPQSAPEKDDITKRSTLNPLAKEFVMGKGREQQVPTPPQRPQTQSPVNPGMMQQISQPMPHPYMPTYTVMPPTVVNQAPQPSPQNFKTVKRAVVSVGPRNDLTAAQAATGQPLFNQATVQAQQPYIPYFPNYQAVMPMPAATGRMVTPTSMPMVPTSHGAQSSQSHQHSTIFMPGQAQPMPAHLPATQFPFPAHMPMATNNMGSQANQQGGQPQPITHPAPSPVQQHGNSQSHQQGRPPNSGTPQPAGGPYPHMAPTNIQGHPPLIPSPQNQSPQTMHNPGYPYVSQHHIFQQGTTGQHYTQQHMPTGGNQSMHAGPSSQLGHGAQIVVMPNPQPGQVQPHHAHNQQFQQHMGGPNQQHMMQPTGMPAGFQGSNPSTNVVHQFVPQVASGPPPVATVPPYQQNH